MAAMFKVRDFLSPGCGTLKKSGYDSQDILNSFVKNLIMLYSEPASTLVFRSAMNA